MNYMIDADNGRHPFSPYYMGDESDYIELTTCHVCEKEVDVELTATVKEAMWTCCAGCIKGIDLNDQFGEMTSFEMQSIINQLKPIL